MSLSGVLKMDDVDIPDDEIPPTTSPFEFACEECGKELHYGGRGRKPRFCDDHKPGAGKGRAKGGARNDALAREAANALSQLNALIGVTLLVPALPILGDNPAYLPHTAMAIAQADEGFNAAAYSALQTDPALCKMILRVGSASGKIALVVAYGMLAGAVVPVGIDEYKERKANADRPSE